MHILVTGFEPFGNDQYNASGEAVQLLPEQLDGHRISTAVLPVSFQRSGEVLGRLLNQHQPDALICVGEAGGRTEISLEVQGANEDDARIPDNDGAQPANRPIVQDGKWFRSATVDPQAVLRVLRQRGHNAYLSSDAGRFVCNHVAYLAYGQNVPALFIHVPALRPSDQKATVGAETDVDGIPSPDQGAASYTFDGLVSALTDALLAVIALAK